jgi:heme-degrading monooxygenase HmoA
MPVTELATLRLKPNAMARWNVLLQNLRIAKSVQDCHSGFPLTYLQQVEDPSILYVVSPWETPSAHTASISTDANKALVELFRDMIDIEAIVMYHLTLDTEATPLPLHTPVVSINRHFVKKGQTDAFYEKLEEVKGLLAAFTAPRAVSGGWRIEKERDTDGKEKEEWVLFSGFESVEHHNGFTRTKEFSSYRAIMEFVDGLEVKHARRLEIV